MINWNIDDYGLSAETLEEKYEKQGTHPTYDYGLFRLEAPGPCESGMGYWNWVVDRLQDEQDELDSDSPYN